MIAASAISLNDVSASRFFLALALLICLAHMLGHLAQQLRLPRVFGELGAGLFLGPTCLGYYFPDAYTWLFGGFESAGRLLAGMYWVGLVLLMFISGFEVQRSVNKRDRRLIGAVLLGGTILPVLVGWLAPTVYDFSGFLGEAENISALQIVIGIALGVTSIPVISKIFFDLGIINSRFAKVVLTAATIEDVILWAGLASATGLVAAHSSTSWGSLQCVLLTLIFFGLGLFCLPAILKYGNTLQLNYLIKSSVTGYSLFLCILFAAVAGLLSVNPVFGGLLAGIVVGTMPNEQFDRAKSHIKEIALGFFIPIYFAIVGLKLDLVHHLDLLSLAVFLLFAVVVKVGGVFLAARTARASWLSSTNLAVAMNARGGPGIVLATVAFDLGIINEAFFVILVLVALLTSVMAGFWFQFVLSRGWELLPEREGARLPCVPAEGSVPAQPAGDAPWRPESAGV